MDKAPAARKTGYRGFPSLIGDHWGAVYIGARCTLGRGVHWGAVTIGARCIE
jgi:hypothetical protein